ncbi:MAG: 2-amino-4-hydroxy-6-hydroxymethyldihydropteridine diphosphokinase, partial [Hyphomicrobiales bacterium]
VDIPGLTIPHKSITERAFVLVPLQEIAGTMTLNGKTMSELIEQLPDEGASITKMTEKRWIPIV